MNLRQMTYFVMIAEAGGFAPAARRLNISQPALSARMKELEQEVGAPLLDRHPRGATLTAAGDRFLPYAQDAVRAFDEAARLFDRKPSDLAIRLGINPTLGGLLLPRLLQTASLLCPQLSLHVQQGSSRVLMERLAANEIDAALCYAIPPAVQLNATPLYSEDLALIGTSASLPAALGSVRLSELAGVPLVLDPASHIMRNRIESTAVRCRLNLMVAAEVEPLSAKITLMRQQRLCTIGPRYLFQDQIADGTFQALSIVDPTMTLTLYLALRRDLRDPARQHVLSVTTATFDDLIATPVFAWRRPGFPDDAV